MLIKKILKNIKEGRVTCQDVLGEYLPRILAGQKRLNTFITVLEKRAVQQAQELDNKIKVGTEELRLLGIPIAIKDNMLLEGTRTTCGSKMLKNYISPYTATALRKLEEEGAIIVGKTNMDEFAMGSSGEHSAFGPTRNPHDLTRVPGGSSSGSAACVADNQTIAALGSDTGGSIRQPAAFCGVVGMKPTYNMVSRYGLVAFGSSLDQIGPLASTVEDAARVFDVIVGYDPRDSTSTNKNWGDNKALDCVEKSENSLKFKIGIPIDYIEAEGLSKEISKRIEDIGKKLEKKGVCIRFLSFDSYDSLRNPAHAIAAYYIVSSSEASANLARFDGIKYGYRSVNATDLINEYKLSRQYGFGNEVKRRIMIGTHALSSGYYDAYYLKAQKVREIMRLDFQKVFNNDVDFILSPVTPSTAFKISEKIDDPLKMYLSDIYTISYNLVGLPAISIPVGKDSTGLPIGAQLIGRWHNDRHLFAIAREIEKIYA